MARCDWDWTLPECIEDHWARPLGARKCGNHWRGACPLCGTDGAFEISIRNGQIVWNCHRKPKCDHDELRILLWERVVCRAKTRRRSVSPTELEKLIGLPDCALRLRIACLAWGLPPKEAAAKLGMSRRTYYRAVSAVPDLAQDCR